MTKEEAQQQIIDSMNAYVVNKLKAVRGDADAQANDAALKAAMDVAIEQYRDLL